MPRHCSQAERWWAKHSFVGYMESYSFSWMLLYEILISITKKSTVIPQWWTEQANFWCECSSKKRKRFYWDCKLSKKKSLSAYPSYRLSSSFVCRSHPGIDYLMQPAPLAGLGAESSNSLLWRYSGALQFGIKAFYSQGWNDTGQEGTNWSDRSSSVW